MKFEAAKKINHIPSLISFILVFIFGLGFLILSLTVFKTEIDLDKYEEVSATITKIYPRIEGEDEQYDVYVHYEYNGNSYSDVLLNAYDSKWKRGDRVKIYVNKLNPEEFINDNSGIWVFSLISGIFAAIGLGGFIYNVKQLNELRREEI